jgi:hypothetical protein
MDMHVAPLRQGSSAMHLAHLDVTVIFIIATTWLHTCNMSDRADTLRQQDTARKLDAYHALHDAASAGEEAAASELQRMAQLRQDRIDTTRAAAIANVPSALQTIANEQQHNAAQHRTARAQQQAARDAARAWSEIDYFSITPEQLEAKVAELYSVSTANPYAAAMAFRHHTGTTHPINTALRKLPLLTQLRSFLDSAAMLLQAADMPDADIAPTLHAIQMSPLVDNPLKYYSTEHTALAHQSTRVGKRRDQYAARRHARRQAAATTSDSGKLPAHFQSPLVVSSSDQSVCL